MNTQQGDWSKLKDYLTSVKLPNGTKPRDISLTQQNLRDITGSTQQGKFYAHHKGESDIEKQAAAAGFSVVENDDDSMRFT